MDGSRDGQTRRRQAGELAVVIGFLALAGLVFQQTRTSLAEQGAADGGAMFNAAMFPELLAWSLVLLAALRVLQIVRATPSPPAADAVASQAVEEGRTSRPVALVCLGLFLGYLLLLRPLGYHLMTPLFLFGCYYVLGTRNLVLAAGLAIATSLTMSFVFEYWMNVILPVGMFGIGF